MRSGKQAQEAAQIVGVHARTVTDWLAWYRQGGLDLVKARKKGGYGQVSRLNPQQQQALIDKSREEGFVSVKDGVIFAKETFGITYTESGMSKVLIRLSLRKKVPRPRNAKASEEVQVDFQKGG